MALVRVEWRLQLWLCARDLGSGKWKFKVREQRSTVNKVSGIESA
jgi:hypothetical protein